MKRYSIDKTMKKLLVRLQEGIPLSLTPYKVIADELGVSEDETIARILWLRKEGFLKRLGFNIDTGKLGLVSTLVGCRIPKCRIVRASKIIAGYKNISHNYLRRHFFNMWFTLTAGSERQLDNFVSKLKFELMAQDLVSLPTEKVFKLKFGCYVA